MKFIIESIKIENFKSVKETTITLNKQRTEINGDNETGKTTIYDAILWCLTGKNSAGEAQFDVIPKNTHEVVSPSVTLECKIDEVPITLKRTLKAKFNKDKTYKKHETELEINGIVKGVRDFEQYIEEHIAKQDIFKLLTNPYYFTTQIIPSKGRLVWQIQREMLEELLPDEIKTELGKAKSNAKYADLIEPLLRHGKAEIYKQSLKNDLKKTEKLREEFPVRVDQQARNFVEIDFDIETKKRELQEVQAQITEVSEQIKSTAAEYSHLNTQLFNELQATKSKIQELHSAHREAIHLQEKAINDKKHEETKDLQKQLAEAKDEYHKIDKMIQALTQNKAVLEKEKENALANLKTYSELLSNTKNSRKETSVEDKCPTCKQPLPKEQVEQLVKKEQDAQRQMEEKYSAQIKQAEQKLNSILSQISSTDELLNKHSTKDILEKINALTTKIEAIEGKYLQKTLFEVTGLPDFEKQLAELSQAQTEIENKINSLTKERDTVIAKLENEVDRLTEVRKKISAELQKVSHNERVQKVIDELESEHSEILETLDKIRYNLDLVQQFIEERTSSITPTINGKFELVKWKLFDFTQDGELRECCIPTVNGVEYSDLSNSTKLLAGLDIIKSFQKHYDLYLPVCIDNAESTSSNFEMDNQIIVLTKVIEPCPMCGNTVSSRRGEDGLWTCLACKHKWKKRLKYIT